MIRLNTDKLKKLCDRLSTEDRDIVCEFLDVLKKVNDITELDEYVDMLLGVADNIDLQDQEIIYDVIDEIQNEG